jgi:hypothetical protein
MELAIVEMFRKVMDPRTSKGREYKFGIYPHICAVCSNERSAKLQGDISFYNRPLSKHIIIFPGCILQRSN